MLAKIMNCALIFCIDWSCSVKTNIIAITIATASWMVFIVMRCALERDEHHRPWLSVPDTLHDLCTKKHYAPTLALAADGAAGLQQQQTCAGITSC